MEIEVIITGECFCGAIKYQVDGELGNIKSCHCCRCRRVFSSQASASARVEPSNFKWLAGENNLTSFINKQDFGIRFCETCGSTLCSVFKGDIYQVFLGYVNDDPEMEISKHIFIGSKASWEVIPERLIQYQENSPPDA